MVLWSVPEDFAHYHNIKFVEGMPDIDQFDGKHRILLIIDDLMHEINDKTCQIFTRGSHHLNISVIFLTQNIFHGTKHNRTMNLNTHYLVLFKNPRDATQITYLARQMFPKHPHFLVDAFNDATSMPFGYLLIDLKQDTDDMIRIRTGLFDDDDLYVYEPK